MSALYDRIANLPSDHRSALEWFDARRGSEIPKPRQLNGIHLSNPQTGIQKPKGWSHAVSVRQTLANPYDDHAPVAAPDGSWAYRYYQERTDPDVAAGIATNRALFANRDDDVPVAVMIQVKAKPGVLYRVWGLAKVTAFQDGYFLLQGYNDQGELPSTDFAYPISPPHIASVAEATSPESLADARRKIDAQIVARQGGKAFRDDALKRFDGRCAISGWAVQQVLEAAHIVPYRGAHTNTPDNALLLRADLHTLFDRQLISIDPDTLHVKITEALSGTPYGSFSGTEIAIPKGVRRAQLQQSLRTRAALLIEQSPPLNPHPSSAPR